MIRPPHGDSRLIRKWANADVHRLLFPVTMLFVIAASYLHAHGFEAWIVFAFLATVSHSIRYLLIGYRMGKYDEDVWPVPGTLQ